MVSIGYELMFHDSEFGTCRVLNKPPQLREHHNKPNDWTVVEGEKAISNHPTGLVKEKTDRARIRPLR